MLHSHIRIIKGVKCYSFEPVSLQFTGRIEAWIPFTLLNTLGSITLKSQ